MKETCNGCEYSERFNNESSFCKLKPYEKPVKDWEQKPEYCPNEQSDDSMKKKTVVKG